MSAHPQNPSRSVFLVIGFGSYEAREFIQIIKSKEKNRKLAGLRHNAQTSVKFSLANVF